MTRVGTELLTTRDAAARIGVSEATVKRWSDSGALACQRTPGGHRKFLAGDVEALAARLRGGVPPGAPAPFDQVDVHRLLLAGDAVTLFSRAHAWVERQGTIDEFFDLRLAPALVRVGEQWARGELSVADEHAATTVATEVVDRLAAFVDRSPQRGVAISTCLEGERHQLASRMAGLLLREAGFHALSLGADTPLTSLLSLVESADARVVCLSASSCLRGNAGVTPMLDRIVAVTGPRKATVLVGGEAFAPPFVPPPQVRYVPDMRALTTVLGARGV